jgi:hypothetical protein
MEVYVLHHVHLLGDEDEVKLIGVYSTEERARAAAGRLASQPGFSDYPKLLDLDDDPREGFEIAEYEVDRDHWTEGYVTVDAPE